MQSTQNYIIGAVAGATIIAGGAAYFLTNGFSFLVGGIHSTDFRKASIEVVGTACADPQLIQAGVTKIPLHDGTYQLGQYQFELVGDVRYGDVSGHTGESKSDKAVFVGSCSASGKTSQVLFVYGMEDGKPARMAFADLSAAQNTLVQSYSVGDGAIQVKANQGNPPTLVTLNYALLNGNLVSLNSPNPAPPVVAVNQTQDMQAQDVSDNSEDKIGFQSFHDTLAPYGEWIDNSRWGTVWHPTQVPADFRPYRDGHWENTDEYGTVWVSDYSWGDVPFHYGRWGYDPNNGWVWVPGYVWSPAWVAWREGAGNIGWLPIPPGAYDGDGDYADNWNDWYGYRDLYGASMDEAAFLSLWSFVPAEDIYAPAVQADIIAPSVTIGFADRTRGWTHFDHVHGHLANRAIDGGRFRAAFGRPLPASNRHDFAAHHGPITTVDRGRALGRREMAHGGPSHNAGGMGNGFHSVPFRQPGTVGNQRFGHTGLNAYGRIGAEHTRAMAGYSRGGGEGMGNSHSMMHRGEGFSRSGAGGFSRAGSEGYSRSSSQGFSRTGGEGFSRTGAQGFSRPGAQGFSRGGEGYSRGGGGFARSGSGGGFAQRPSFGGSVAQHSAFGGGNNGFAPRPGLSGNSGGFSQRPSFGGGGFAQRPATPAPVQRSAPVQRTAPSNDRRRH